MTHLTFEQRHDLRKTILFCPSKTYSSLYVHPDFRTAYKGVTTPLPSNSLPVARAEIVELDRYPQLMLPGA